jgi:Uma2 family endonuclease
MTITPVKWTVADYHHMIASGLLDERRVELLRGEIVEMMPEGEPHAYFSSEAGEYLIETLGKRASVRPAKPITLPNNSEPEPDVAIVQRLGREYLDHHPYPENIFWLIEYADSSLDKDLKLKSSVYAEVNIPEYWVIDLRRRCLIVFREPKNGEYLTKMTLADGIICPVAFPSVEIAVQAIVSS